MPTIINLTPHDITFRDAAGMDTVYPTTGSPARCNNIPTKAVDMSSALGMPVVSYTPGDVVGLPAQADGTIYIVSAFVLGSVRRGDLIAPDTLTGCIRDKGQVIAVTQWQTA